MTRPREREDFPKQSELAERELGPFSRSSLAQFMLLLHSLVWLSRKRLHLGLISSSWNDVQNRQHSSNFLPFAAQFLCAMRQMTLCTGSNWHFIVVLVFLAKRCLIDICHGWSCWSPGMTWFWDCGFVWHISTGTRFKGLLEKIWQVVKKEMALANK